MRLCGYVMEKSSNFFTVHSPSVDARNVGFFTWLQPSLAPTSLCQIRINWIKCFVVTKH